MSWNTCSGRSRHGRRAGCVLFAPIDGVQLVPGHLKATHAVAFAELQETGGIGHSDSLFPATIGFSTIGPVHSQFGMGSIFWPIEDTWSKWERLCRLKKHPLHCHSRPPATWAIATSVIASLKNYGDFVSSVLQHFPKF